MTHARARVHAHPLRDRLLYEYAGRAASPSELARRLDEPLNLVSYHTRVLVEHGYLELVGTEQRRGGTAHVYRAIGASVIEDDDWVTLPPSVRRMLARGVLGAVAQDSREAALAGGFDAASAHISRWPLRLDDDARAAATRVLRGVLDDLQAIQVAADERAAAARRQVDVVLLGFFTSGAPASARAGARSR